MRKSAKEEDGSYWYELSKKEITDLVMKKYGKIIKKNEESEVVIENGVAIMVAPRKTTARFRAWRELYKDMIDEVDSIDFAKGYIYYQRHDQVEREQLKQCKLMKYTGLKDKKGKEIYEGDIIQIYKYDDMQHKDIKNHISEVRFFYGMFAWFSQLTQDWHSFYNLSRPGEPYEVIGNIYENPELINPN